MNIKTMNNKRKLEIKARLAQKDGSCKLIKPANLKSNVWHRFDLVQIDGVLQDFACCAKCKDILAYSTKTGTGSLIRHNCDNQNQRRNKKRLSAQAAATKASFDPLDYEQNDSDNETEDFYEPKKAEARKRAHQEAFAKENSMQAKMDATEDDADDEEYGEYIDMDYLIKPEPELIEDDQHEPASNIDENELNDSVEVNTDACCNNILKLLSQTVEGKSAMAHYDQHNRLNLKHRQVVFNALHSLMYNNGSCSSYNKMLKKLSMELMQLFPEENYNAMQLHRHFTRLESGEQQVEDRQLYNLLNSWKLTHLYEHFVDESITVDVLKLMEPKHVTRLFKNLAVGDEVRFDYKFKTWMALGSPLIVSIQQQKPTQQQHKMRKATSIISLAKILNTSIGINLRKYYDQHKEFSETQRITLINSIARYCEANERTLSLSQCQELEKEIVATFPTEKLEYYTNGVHGRIYTRLHSKHHKNKNTQQQHAIGSSIANVVEDTNGNI